MNTRTKRKNNIISKALFAVTLLAVLSMTIAPAAAQITWSSDIRLTDDPAAQNPRGIAVDSSGNLHVVWQDNRHGNDEIYYTKLDNDGTTLVDDTRLTDDPAASYPRGIAVDSSGNLHVVWYDMRDGNYEIYYTKLSNIGATLIDDTRLTDDPAFSMSPKIAVDSTDNIHITWRDNRDGNWEVYYTKLDGSNGNTLVDDTRLTDDPAYSLGSAIAVDSSSNVHIAWQDKRDGNDEIYYTKLDNNGNTLVDDTRLTDDPASSGWLEIAADLTGNVHITWRDKRDGNSEIYYTKLDNNGNTLVDDTRLTDDTADSRNPSIAADSSENIHIAWKDGRDGNNEIYYTKLDNNGNTLVDDTRLTDDTADSRIPSIAADSNDNIHIIWYDTRDGNREIYYKKGSAPCKPAIEVNKTVWDPVNETWVEKIEDAEISQTYRFRCEVHNSGTCCDLTNIKVVDTLSDSLEYANNATVDGVPREPDWQSGNQFGWNFAGPLAPCETITIKFDAHMIKCRNDTNTQNATAWCDKTKVSDADTVWVNCTQSPLWHEINAELDTLKGNVSAATMPSIIQRRLVDKLEYAKALKENAKIECEAGNFDGATKKLGVAKSQVESFASMVKITRRISSEDKASFLADSTEIIGKIQALIEYIETEHKC